MSSETGDLDRFLSEDCEECGTPGPQRHLSAVGGCWTCAAADPRPVAVLLRNEHAGVVAYDLPLPPRRRSAEGGAAVFPPGLGLFPSSHEGPFLAPFRDGGVTPPRASRCYRMPGGAMVHVKPGCRCPR